MRALKNVLSLLLFLAYGLNLFGQPFVKLAFPRVSETGLRGNNDKLILYWDTENGLPQNTVNDIVQRKDGFIFLATNDGFVRFDGVRFKDYRLQDYPEMISNRIKYLFIDNNDIIYIVTESNDIIKFSDEKFTTIEKREVSAFSRLYAITPEGDVYFDDNRGNLIREKNGNRSFVRLPGISDFKDVRKILVKNEHQMILFRLDSAIIFDKGKITRYKSEAPHKSNFIPEITGNDNRFLFANRKGLFEIKEGQLIKLLESTEEIGKINDMLIDSDNSVYVISGNGLFRITGGRIDIKLNKENGLLSNQLKSVLKDSDGGIFAGSNDAGLIRITNRVFKSINLTFGLGNEIVNPLLIRKNGNVLAGTNGGGIYEFNNGKFVSSYFQGSHIWSVIEAHDGSIYAGVASNVLRKKAADGTESDIYLPPSADDYIVVNSLLEESPGRIWIGTTSGIYSYGDGKVYSHFNESGIGFRINDIKKDSSGIIWMAGQEGLVRYDGSRFTVYKSKDFPGLKYLRCLFIYNEEIWIGSYGNGLINFKDGRFTAITHRNGLFDNSISSINLDKQNTFWFTSNKGIFAVDKSGLDNIIRGKRQKVNFIKFGSNDGMLSRECNGGFSPSSASDKDGNFYIPTLRGVVIFNPLDVKKEMFRSKIFIEGYEINNAYFNFNRQSRIELPFGNNRVNFYVNSPYFNDNHNLLYKYKLEGFKDEWVRQSYMNNVITFTSLPPGTYKLIVRVYYAFDEEGAEETVVEVTVPPPFYMTGTFYLLIFISIVLIFILILKIRERALEKNKIELENTVHERTSELIKKNKQLEVLNSNLADSQSELLKKNETLKQREEELTQLNNSKDLFLTIISHDLRNPLFSISSFADILEDENEELTGRERLEMIGKIKNLSRNLYELVNDLLAWARIQGGKESVNAHLFDLNQLLRDNITALQGVANQKSITLTQQNSSALMPAYADRPMISSVIQNLITNAIKFSHPDSVIVIKSEMDGDFIKVSVSDSGVGIPDEMKDKLFRIDAKTTTKGTGGEKGAGVGLILTDEIIRKNGGEIRFESTEGKGSVFYFTIPSQNLMPGAVSN